MAYRVLDSPAMQTCCALFLVLMSGIISSCCAIVNTYDVYPKAVCQLSSADRHIECLTLSEIMNERDKYFTSNSTLIFHNGDHILQGEVISVFKISNFTLQGYRGGDSSLSSPTITCVNSSIFFSQVSIRIASINFSYCSISLWQVKAVVQDSSFKNGRAVDGGALAVHFSSVKFGGANSFEGNTAENGGAIYADRSNLTFSESTFFTGHKAVHGCLSYCEGDNICFGGVSTFTSNAAKNGGAVYAFNDNGLCFNGHSSFVNNSAELNGGAVFAQSNNNLSFHGNSSFLSNSAGNNGGTVFIISDNALSFNENSTFVNNSAEYGGVVYAEVINTLIFNGYSSFTGSTAIYGGAILAYYTNTLSFNGNNRFMSNTAASFGGAVCAMYSNTLSFRGNSNFISNAAVYGGAVFANGGAVDVERNTLSFSGNNMFMRNTADEGGAVQAKTNNALSFTGNNRFMNNSAGSGGAVHAKFDNALSFSGNSIFISNTARYSGGAVCVMHDNTLSFNGDSSFMSNTAKLYGGAVCALEGSLSLNGNSGFINNTAKYGGAVEMNSLRRTDTLFSGNSSFVNNKAHDSGGAVYALNCRHLAFEGKSTFINNTAEHGAGGAVLGDSETTVIFSGTTILEDNSAIKGGGISLSSDGTLQLSGMVSLSFNIAHFGGGAFVHESNFASSGKFSIMVAGNKATHGGGLFLQSSIVILQNSNFLENVAINKELQGGYGGAILAHSSTVLLQWSCFFGNNSADFGGGLALIGGVLLIKQGSELSFKGNLAHRRGGAIFVKDDAFTSCAFDISSHDQISEPCFFQVEDRLKCYNNLHTMLEVNDTQKVLIFDNNTANQSGNVMYGGLLESCVVCGDSEHSTGIASGLEVFKNISEYHGSDGYSRLSSNSYKVCICENNVPSCDQREVNVTLYPGQSLVTSVVAVGQMNGTVPSIIRAVSDDLITTSDFKETQPAENDQDCSQLQWPLLSKHSRGSMELYSNEQCSISRYPLKLQINFLPCPVGFTLSEQGSCICDERLRKYTQNCSIQTLTINRLEGDSFWMGVEGSEKLILHAHCPFDYCIKESTDVQLSSTANYSGTDLQCANGRSGILCGACQPERSLALGSSRCLSGCSNNFFALLLVFAFAGVVLVAFLFLCRLTVAEGTLSGLIFYANVLAVNQTVFFPSGERNLLTVFIAWLNLDLGIETCFFYGLDVYYSTWLQFVFPIYIWVIVGAIIVLADRSVRVARIIGNSNPVAVLATLFLLSYTKLLRAIMTAFSFTTLDYPDGDSKYVWLYDGNIGYLDRHDGRHIALFLFSLLFLLFVFLPYTLLLLCGQWIQRKLWWLPSTWQLYTNSFLDAYYGPYNYRHRYWTGLLLLLRFFMLFVATIINIRNPQDPFSNLLAIQLVSTIVIASYWVIRGLYKKWYLDLMEISFHLNLTILVGGTYQVRQSGGNQAALVYTSVGVVFVTFIGIVSSAVVKQVKEKVAQYRHRAIRQIANTVPDDERYEVSAAVSKSTVTYSELEIIRSHPDQMSGELVLRPVSDEDS